MTSRKISDRMRINDVRNKYLTFYRNLPNSRLLLAYPLLLFFDLASILVLVFYARRTKNARLRFRGMVEFFGLKKKVRRYGDGKLSFLDKRIFWDKLYL